MKITQYPLTVAGHAFDAETDLNVYTLQQCHICNGTINTFLLRHTKKCLTRK